MAKSYINTMDDVIKDLPWQVSLTVDLYKVNSCMPGISEDEELDESKPNMLHAKFVLMMRSPSCLVWGLGYLSRVIYTVAILDSKDEIKEFFIIQEASDFTSNPMEQTFPVEKFPFSQILPQVQEGMVKLIQKVLNKPKSDSLILMLESEEPYVFHLTQDEFAECVTAWMRKEYKLEEKE